MAGQKLKRKGGSGAAAANHTAPAEPNAKPRYASKAAAPSPDAANNYGKVALHMLSGELLVEEDLAGDRWYDCAPEWPAPAPGGLSGSRADWAELSGHALAAVTRAFERKAGTSDDGRQRVLNREKTVGDKIAAVTLMVQESPVYRLDEMRMLLGFAKKQGRRERGPAIDALKDLFVNDLLPDDRRLVPLASRNFAVARNALSKRHLAYAMFESELKDVFREFLTVVEECSKDAVVHFKMKAARVCFDLLVAKPENEKALLAMLVNELGSPERKVASSASYYLNLLVSKHHPVMKLVVVREVELLVHRPNVGLRTRYYAVSFLNQIRFSTDHDVELARRLVRIYMDLFAESVASDREGVKQKGSGGLETKESRLMGALLTGVNRAFPYSKPGEDDTDYSKQFESLFQVAHAQSLTSATQALSFLLQVAQTNSVVSDRFYRALYSRIMDTAAASESKQALFMNLLFKAMKADVSAKRVKAYSKRLLQSALQSSPGFAAGALLVLSEVMVMRRKGLLKSFVLLSEGDDADEDFQDVDDGESDDDGKRPEPVGAESIADGSDDGGDAHDSVVKQSEEEDATRVAKWPAIATPNAMVWGTGYDPSKRDPIHARAGESCLWEIVALCSHYHPSVVSFAKRLREEMAAVEYKGDPLKDFTLGSFLDKFSYRKPKKHVVDSLHGRRSSRLSERPLVNTEEFRQLGDAGEIEEDEKFYLRFFQTNPERTRRTTAGAEGEADPGNADVREDDGDSEEEAFELAMKEEMKRLGGGADLAGPGDIDDVDEDEMRAFASTFGEDVLDVSGGSSSSESDNADGMRLIPSEDDEESDDEATRKRKKKMAKAGPTFAPVEYYADVIAQEEQDHADDDDDDSSCGIDDDEDRALAILCGEEDEEDEAEIVGKENGQRKGKGKRKGSGGEARGTGSGKASKKRRRQ
jgi:ribosome biogenesis protein MAK21